MKSAFSAALNWSIRFRLRQPDARWRRFPLWLLARLYEAWFLMSRHG